VLVLGHGAGGDIDARDLAALADALPGRGVTVVRVRQPWRVAGRKIAGPPAQLDRAWTAVVADLRAGLPALAAGAPLVVGGRSAGARVACRTAAATGAVGCLALAFPLHPPGRPAQTDGQARRTRAPELAGTGVPTLVVQGERDTFGGPELFARIGPAHLELVAIPYADHGMKVPARAPLTQAAALELVVAGVAGWLARLVPRP
jgi:uncharacterized protein